jgi:hypothetical protein
MKKYLLITALCCSTHVFCQTPQKKIDITGSVEIVYESSRKSKTAGNQPFYYVDGELWSPRAVGAIELENIKDLKVNQNANGNGEVRIILKDPSKVADLVFLSKEIEKYLGKLDMPTIYMMDEEFIKDDLTAYKIKQNNILRIEVMTSDDIASLKQLRLKLRVVKIFTKSQKNLDKTKQIYIRGNSIDTEKKLIYSLPYRLH